MTPRWRRASLALVLLAIPVGADEPLLRTEPGPAAAAATRDFEAGEETAACRAFLEQLRTGSEDPWAYRHAAICAHSVEGLEEPFDDFIAAADQDDVLALWGRAYLSFLEKDYQAAEVGARRAVDLRPRFAFAWNLLGISLEQLSRQEEAMAAIETSLKLAPDLPFPRPNLLRMVSGELEALLPALEEAREVLAVRSMPPSTSTPGERFATAPETGKLPEETSAAMAGAEELLQRLDRSLGAGQSWIQEGRLLLRLGLDTEGVAALRHAAELARATGDRLTEADAKYEEAMLRREGGRQQDAQRLFHEARRLYSAHDSSYAELWEAWSRVNEAQALVALGRHRQALDVLGAAKDYFHRTGNYVGEADAWFIEASAWFGSGETDGEVDALEEGRRLYRGAEMPAKVADTWLRQGLAGLRTGDREGAADAFRKAGEIYLGLADYHAAWHAFYKEGSALSRIELHGSASLEAFRRSLQAIREDKRLARAERDRLALARAWHREGNSLFQLDETGAALEAFRTARKLYPRDAATDERLQTWVDEGLVHLHLETYKAALDAFDAAKRSLGADTDPVRRGNALLFRAKALRGLARLEAARTDIREARALFEAAGNLPRVAATWSEEKKIVVQIEQRDGTAYERLDALLAELVEEWPGIDEPSVAYSGAPPVALLRDDGPARAKESYVEAKRRITRLMIARPEEREILLDRWVAESVLDEPSLWQPAFLVEGELESKPVEAALALEAWMALATAAERKDLLLHTARLALEHLEEGLGPKEAARSSLPWVELAEATKGLLRQRARLLTTYAEILVALERDEAALEPYRRSEELFRSMPDARGEAASLLEEARILFRLERFGEAVTVYERVRRLSESNGFPSILADALREKGQVISRLGEHEEGLTLIRQARSLSEDLRSPQWYAGTWQAEGQVLGRLGKDQAALAAYTEAVELFRQAGDRAAEADALLEQAGALMRVGDRAATLAAIQNAKDIYEGLGRVEGRARATWLEGRALLSFGPAAEAALECLRQAKLLSREAGDEQAEAEAWLDEAAALHLSGEHDKALAALRRLRESPLAAANAATRGQTWLREASQLAEIGRSDDALDAYRRARPLLQAAGDRGGEGSTWVGEGWLLLQRPKMEDEALAAARKGRSLLRRAGSLNGVADSWLLESTVLAIRSDLPAAMEAAHRAGELSAKGGRDEARVWEHEAQILFRQEEYERSLDLLRRAREVFRDFQLEAGEARTWLIESRVFLHLGSPSDALEAARRSREMVRASGDELIEGWSAVVEGRVLSAIGDNAGCLESVREAKELFRSADARHEEAMALMYEGDTLLALGRKAAARKALSEASELAEHTGARFTRSNTLLSTAWLLLSEDDLEETIRVALEAARQFADAGVRHNEMSALLAAARAYSRAGDDARAAALARQAIDLHSGIRVTRIEEQHRTLADQRIASAFDILVPALLSQGRPDKALEWAERARARVLLDLLSSGERFGDHPPEELAAESGRLRAELARNQAARRGAEDPDRRRELDEERVRLLDQLDRNQYERRAAEPSELVAAEPLAAGEIHELAGQVGPILKFYTTESEVLGFLIRSDEPLRVETVEIGQAELQERIQSFARDLANPLFADRAATAAAELWDRLVEPFVADLPAGGPLTLVPHGPLHQLPFGALRDREGRRLFTLWDLSVTPSASTLAVARGRHRPPSQDETFVAFASGRGLPLTAHEANLIAGHFGDDSRVFTPTEARFERYENFARHARQLLVTTRGGFEEFSIHGTYLEILPTPGVHDSRLSAAEIAAIPLDAELVVLAACDTARGRALLSDERLDLTRAFLAAGAAAVLATRWKVPESPATTRFLVDFYSAYRTGGPGGGPMRKDEALSAARRAAVARGDAAAIWAAWVLVGDAR